jgi:glycosyltransferase involved in cell wall biosynthesis
MKVAYICYSFAPRNSIGSIRHSKIVKFLVRKGCDVTVFTETIREETAKDFALLCHEYDKVKFIRLPELHRQRKNVTKVERDNRQSIRGKSTERLKKNVEIKKWRNFYRDLQLDLNFFTQFRKKITSPEIRKDYDLIISSYKLMGCHWAAEYLKPLCSQNAIWIADFRDLPNDGGTYPTQLFSYNYFLQARVCNKADGVTAVSEGLKNRLISQKWTTKKQNFFCSITNGYDLDDVNRIEINDQNNNSSLSICYTGQIIPGDRDASLLFSAIEVLFKTHGITEERIQIHFAGPEDSYSRFLSQAKQYGVEKTIINHGYTTHTQAIALQKSSDVLLLLTTNKKNESGILTGKFLEYIGLKLPIIALITGDAKASEVSTIITNNSIGYSFYYLDKEKAQNEIVDLLLLYLDQKSKTGTIEFMPNETGIHQYSYSQIASKLIDFYEAVKLAKQNVGYFDNAD